MTAEIKTVNSISVLIVTVPISPRPSASGKTTVIASTNGNQPSAATHEGKPIIIGLNAYVK